MRPIDALRRREVAVAAARSARGRRGDHNDPLAAGLPLTFAMPGDEEKWRAVAAEMPATRRVQRPSAAVPGFCDVALSVGEQPQRDGRWVVQEDHEPSRVGGLPCVARWLVHVPSLDPLVVLAIEGPVQARVIDCGRRVALEPSAGVPAEVVMAQPTGLDGVALGAAITGLPSHGIAAVRVPPGSWIEVDDPNDLAAARFRFEPQRRAEILDRSLGGHWSFDLLDFSFLRNVHFPTESMIAAMRHALPELLGSYGSTQAVLNEKMAWFLGCPARRVQVLHGAAQLFPILADLLGAGSVAVPEPTFGEYRRAFPAATRYRDRRGIDPRRPRPARWRRRSSRRRQSQQPHRHHAAHRCPTRPRGAPPRHQIPR